MTTTDVEPRIGLNRTAAWVTALASASVLVLLAGLLVPWSWVPGGSLTPARAADFFTADQIARAEAHAREVRVLAWSSYFVSLGVAVALGLSRRGSDLVGWLRGKSGVLARPWWAAVVIGSLALLLIGQVLTLPFALAIRAENLSVGLTTQGLAAWLTDRSLSLLVSWVVTSALLLLVVGCARRSPRLWFVFAGAVAVGLTFVVSLAYPVVVEPLFNNFTSMPAGPLRDSILDLAEAEDVHVDDVLVADASRRTTTLNAYVSGFGGTRRVVVYDNLFNDLDTEQALSVIAHELGHAKDNDVLLGTGLGAVSALFGVALLALALDSRRLRARAGIAGPADPNSVAAILAAIALAGFISSPVQNTISRAIEARADRTALSTTGDVAAFQQVQKQLALRSLADPTPPRLSQFWFGSHPTTLERLGLPASLERAGQAAPG